MKYDTVIFDLDGTLLNTLPDLHAAAAAALSGHNMPERTPDEVRDFVGNGIARLVERCVPAGTDASVTAEVLRDFRAFYGTHYDALTRPYAEIPELVLKLRLAGIKTAVVSNKAHALTEKIISSYFPDTFGVVFGERESIPRKPAPDAVFEALELLSARHALYVGDSETDVATGKNAGLDTVAVTWGFRSREALAAAGAVHFADNAVQLADFILKD